MELSPLSTRVFSHHVVVSHHHRQSINQPHTAPHAGWLAGWLAGVVVSHRQSINQPHTARWLAGWLAGWAQSAVLEGLKVEARARKKGKTGPLELYGEASDDEEGGEGAGGTAKMMKKKGGGGAGSVLPIGFGTGGCGWVLCDGQKGFACMNACMDA